MKALSIFDIFKIGVGPSSSHTLGPWRASLTFLDHIEIPKTHKITVQLYGSLSKTGIGHATNTAVLLGLMDFDPTKIETKKIDSIVEKVKSEKQITIQNKIISFDFEKDIIFERSTHYIHPNTMRFTAFSEDGEVLHEQLYVSVGGGFIETPCISDEEKEEQNVSVPYPINSAAELLEHTQKESCNISDISYKNELAFRSEEEIRSKSKDILDAFTDCIYEGCSTDGILPGGLNVVRRAKKLCDKLLQGSTFSNQKDWLRALKSVPKDFNTINKWVSCFALSVNEQNAAMGRVVTSPTNGSAGVIPAVMMYYFLFCDYQGEAALNKFLYTSAEIGSLFKKGATISAAVGGCQAEIGVSSAMAAAGLTEVLGGSPAQCLMAAEIAIEHHFGLTCDPVKGLVQIPCIERNAMGAIKAITASNLALEGDPSTCIVSLDTAIKTMWDVSLDMNTKYKETSEGGLAINIPVSNPNC